MSCPRLSGPDRLPLEPIQAAFLECGLTAAEVCRRLGWVRPDRPSAATANLNYVLGLKPSINHRKRLDGGVSYHRSFALTIDREKAKAICVAMGVEFDEVYDMPLPEPRPRGGRCACGEKMVRSAPMCGFCRDEMALDMRSAAA